MRSGSQKGKKWLRGNVWKKQGGMPHGKEDVRGVTIAEANGHLRRFYFRAGSFCRMA